MLRFGTAVVGDTQIAVARRGDEPHYIDVSALCKEVAVIQSLDDILDLPDDLLAQLIQRTRSAKATLNASRLRLLAPVRRVARFRDCSIVSAHLAPSFEVMARRVAISHPDKEMAVRAAVAELNKIPFDKVVMSGERDAADLSGEGAEMVFLDGELDFELELAAVIRRRPDGTHELFGYTFYNDWTIRDLQIEEFLAAGGPAGLNGRAKNAPGSNVIGPMVVLAADVPDPGTIQVSAEVDGKLYAAGSVAGASWTYPAAVEHLFAGQAMAGHELVGSGTILGGSCFENGDRLKDGAIVQFRSREIGNLTMRSRQS